MVFVCYTTDHEGGVSLSPRRRLRSGVTFTKIVRTIRGVRDGMVCACSSAHVPGKIRLISPWPLITVKLAFYVYGCRDSDRL